MNTPTTTVPDSVSGNAMGIIATVGKSSIVPSMIGTVDSLQRTTESDNNLSPRTLSVVPNEQYNATLEYIIHRDYFPDTQASQLFPTTTMTPRDTMYNCTMHPNSNCVTGISLTHFHATTTSNETATLIEQHQFERKTRRRHNERIYTREKLETKQQKEVSSISKESMVVGLRNALFFPLEETLTTQAKRNTNEVKSVASTRVSSLEPPSMEKTLVPTATRFPVPHATANELKQQQQHQKHHSHHWEGSVKDDEESMATDLDEESVDDVSIRTKIRQGQKYQQQIASHGQRKMNPSSSILPINLSYVVPSESIRERSARHVLEEWRKRTQQLRQNQRYRGTVQTNEFANKSNTKRQRKQSSIPSPPPPVRSGDSFAFALRATYKPDKQRKPKATRKNFASKLKP